MSETHPHWQEVGDWKDGKVRSSAKALIWVSLIFAVAFIGLGLPATLAVPDEMARGNHLILVALLFPLVGLGALGIFIHALIGWFKFSASEVLLDPAPGSIGGDFGGRIETGIRYRRDMVVNITLSCLHSRTTGSGKNRSTNTTAVWQREGVATNRRLGRNGTEIAFRFAVPEGLPQSEPSSDDYHHWVLEVECELPGVDFIRSFAVPVFESALPRLSSVDAPYARDSNPMQEPPPGIVRVSTENGELQFYYPWHRRWGSALMLVLFGAVFVAAGWFAGQQGASTLFPLVFCGVGGLVAVIGLYLIGNTLTTRVSSRGVTSVRRIYGIPLRREARIAEISHLERSIGSQTSAGSSTRIYYVIRAHTQQGDKITIADSLEGSRLADFVETGIRNALGPPHQGRGA
jgi:hypothetical protein